MPNNDKGFEEHDPVIEAVKKLNVEWSNTDYSKRSPSKIGGGLVYTVRFKGEDGYWRENYVYERGSVRIAYYDLKQMLTDRNNELIPSYADNDRIRLLFVAIFTLIFAIAVIYVAIWMPTNDGSLKTLAGFLGLGVGYFVGTNVQSRTT